MQDIPRVPYTIKRQRFCEFESIVRSPLREFPVILGRGYARTLTLYQREREKRPGSIS